MDRAALVLCSSSAVDCGRMVAVEPPRAAHSRAVRQEWRPTMTISKRVRTFTMAVASLIASLLLAAAAQPLKVDFSNDSVGAEPKSFLSVVGVWRIENDDGNKVLVVDGRQWKEGQTSAGLADKARALYGDRYAAFLSWSLRLLKKGGRWRTTYLATSGAADGPNGFPLKPMAPLRSKVSHGVG